ncbi:MAG TPA: HD domain-containing protein [Gemmatimonadaceae bacterium]|nr:HD domain-containing protein [Gemmatimonadaceae bacterium]
MKVIRDPLWNNIRVEPLALELIDTAAFQRLRYVRQLGLAFLVYPGASHSRFEHALGTYALARRALGLLEERGDLKGLDETECADVRMAALLHDIGHYPFSHALEEIGALNHEEVARPLIEGGAIGSTLRRALGADAPHRVMDLIRGRSANPLQGLISGSLDLDKIEYLRRDALMCGVPYGEIDADRLLNSLVVIRSAVHPTAHAAERGAVFEAIGIQEKGLSALESLLFAKYQMYRNVYWHHAVRSATGMYKRLVSDALDAGALTADQLAGFTDEGLLLGLEAKGATPLLSALRERRLYKRVIEIPAAELPAEAGEWLADDWPRTMSAENELARSLGLAEGELLIDYPAKTEMLGLDLPVLRRDGRIDRLTQQTSGGTINLPSLSQELYRSARWLRVFSARSVRIPRERILSILA